LRGRAGADESSEEFPDIYENRKDHISDRVLEIFLTNCKVEKILTE
jgi:hypothetical protein